MPRGKKKMNEENKVEEAPQEVVPEVVEVPQEAPVVASQVYNEVVLSKCKWCGAETVGDYCNDTCQSMHEARL